MTNEQIDQLASDFRCGDGMAESEMAELCAQAKLANAAVPPTAPGEAIELARYTVDAFERGLTVQANALPLARALLALHGEGDAVPEGCTPADAMALRAANHVLAQENHLLRAEAERLRDSRDRDWILALADAIGHDSGLNVAIVPTPEACKTMIAAVEDRARIAAERALADARESRGNRIVTLEKLTKNAIEGQRRWPARITPETITPDHIREFYTNGTWPEKMVYCDMLKIIGDLAIRNLEAIAEFERRRDRDKALAEGHKGTMGFAVNAAFAGCYHDAIAYLRSPDAAPTPPANEGD